MTTRPASYADVDGPTPLPAETMPQPTGAELRELCLALPGAVEEFPFRPELSVFKVAGRMFALSALSDEPLRVSVKCDPELGEQLRFTHPSISPGYHLNKRHWLTITIDGSLPRTLVADLIEGSHELSSPPRRVLGKPVRPARGVPEAGAGRFPDGSGIVAMAGSARSYPLARRATAITTGGEMICTFTARRLNAGAYDAFRAAWDPGTTGDELRGWTHIYHARDVADPDVVISFGLFDGSLDELREAQARLGRQSQVGRIDPHVADVLLDGSYEIVEELIP